MAKQKTKPEKVIKSKKSYTIEWIEYADKSTMLHRTNDGFSFFELLGLLEYIKSECQEIYKGTIKPDIIKREVVQD